MTTNPCLQKDPAWLADPMLLAFERAAVDPASFHHREHLRVAWCYLRALPLEEALPRYVVHLRRLAAALGAPRKFHATITWAYLVLLDDAMHRSPDSSFDELLERNPQLLEPDGKALLVCYDRDELDAEGARERFILPRRRCVNP